MKSIYQSKTVWVNSITILVAVAAYFGVNPDVELLDKTASFLVLISPLVNLILRFYTDKKIV